VCMQLRGSRVGVGESVVNGLRRRFPVLGTALVVTALVTSAANDRNARREGLVPIMVFAPRGAGGRVAGDR